MTEKEFLVKFVYWMEGNGLLDSDVNPTYESFLEEHHKEYFEVDFIRKENEYKNLNIQTSNLKISKNFK